MTERAAGWQTRSAETGRRVRICAWCRTSLGSGPGRAPDDAYAHDYGICGSCLAARLAPAGEATAQRVEPHRR